MHAHGFHEVVVGAEPEGPHRRALIAASRDHDDGHLAHLAEPPEHLEPVHVLEAEVEEHKLNVTVLQQDVAAAGDPKAGMIGAPEHGREGGGDGRVILGDEQVRAVFVNVFGGITACDAVANGIVGALEKLGDTASKPLVVRLDGNKVEEGRKILADAAHPLVTLAGTMDEGADKAAELAAK